MKVFINGHEVFDNEQHENCRVTSPIVIHYLMFISV